jgi:ATP-dependent DNA helicase RecQ
LAVLPHLTLVVSPLLALMQDQLVLQRHGIARAVSIRPRADDANDVMARRVPAN